MCNRYLFTYQVVELGTFYIMIYSTVSGASLLNYGFLKAANVVTLIDTCEYRGSGKMWNIHCLKNFTPLNSL